MRVSVVANMSPEPGPHGVACNAPQEGRIVQTCENFTMQELNHWRLEERRRITGVFTDIDDTLTTEGAITADALAALGALQAAGLRVVAITGRPVGWSEPFAARWPVDAIVAENGAVALLPSHEKGLRPPSIGRGQLSKLYQQDAPTRAANFTRMQAVLARIEPEMPGVHRATH